MDSGLVSGVADPSALISSPWIEKILLLLSLAVAALQYANASSATELSATIPPTIMIIALGYGATSLALRSPIGIWAPVFWIRVSLTAYFGVGSIVPVIVNDTTRSYLEGFYKFFLEDILKLNVVVSLFVVIVFFTSDLIFLIYKKFRENRKIYSIFVEKSNFEVETVGWMLLIIGILIKWFIILPLDFKVVDFKIPSFVAELGFGCFIGIFLLGFTSLRNGSRVINIVWFVAVAQFILGIISLNKSDALFPLIMLGLAYLFDKASFSRMVIMFGGLILAYSAATGPVSYARAIIQNVDDVNFPESMTLRIAAVSNYFVADDVNNDSPEVQGSLVRLSYVNAGAFAISQYDQGQPGDSLRHILAVWVPRVIWPNKPIITDIARDFNEAATGNPNSQSAPGLPTEGYWTGGWLGVIFCSGMVALVMGLWSLYSAEVLLGGAWHLFILVLLGMRVGARMDGFIISDLIGPVPFVIVGHIALQFLNRLIAPERKGRLSIRKRLRTA